MPKPRCSVAFPTLSYPLPPAFADFHPNLLLAVKGCLRSGFLLATCMVLAAATPVLASGLVGAWQCQVSFAGLAGEPGPVVFDRSGTVTVDGQPFAYAVLAGNVLRLTEGGQASDYLYELSGDSLVMRYADGSVFNCRRSAAGAPSAISGDGAAAPQGGENSWQLQGAFCHWSGSSSSSSSYSSTRRLSFDGQGRWVYGAESSFSGNAGLAYGGQGNQDSGTYRIVGDQIHYSTAGGERGVAQVKIRQNSGRITEIVVDGKLYAVQLCQ